MNKGELIKKISKKAGLKKSEATAALNATLEAIEECLEEREKVQIAGFGTFHPQPNDSVNFVVGSVLKRSMARGYYNRVARDVNLAKALNNEALEDFIEAM